MCISTNRFLAIAFLVASTSLWLVPFCDASPVTSQGQPPAANRRIGTVKTVNSTAITLTPDSGADITVTIEPATRIVRITPGEKDLKNAAQIQLADVQIGDRLLVAGRPSDDNQSFVASSIVAMKRSDLEAKHQQDLQDWQKRGVDGLVKAVDAAAGIVTISVRSKDEVIHTSGSTLIRRYAPDSVKFDDAKSSTLAEIHPGDQIRARGDRSADGSEVTAEELVSGTFPLFTGTVSSIDASSSNLSIHDLVSKKTVLVKVTQDSQLRQLPTEMAQRIAMRLKAAAAGAMGASASGVASSPGSGNVKMKKQTADSATPPPGAVEGGVAASRNGMGGHSGGALDFQQILNRAPTVSLADLHKGDAVVILATEGKSGSATALKLFSGVEPILQAAPNAAQAMMLAPWNLGGPSGDAGGP